MEFHTAQKQALWLTVSVLTIKTPIYANSMVIHFLKTSSHIFIYSLQILTLTYARGNLHYLDLGGKWCTQRKPPFHRDNVT